MIRLTIRTVEYKENKEITLSELEAYTKEIVPNLEQRYEEVSFIYEEQGAILGRIVGFIHWDHLQIELFYVAKNTQGMGIGTKLVNHVEDIALKNGLNYILLETMSFNAPKFYEKNGYEFIAKIKDSPMKGENRYFLKKQLLF